jgi:hypothetical protein
MADEVIVTYYNPASANKDISSGVYGEKLGGQVLDIGTRSAVLEGSICRVKAKGVGFWLNVGGSSVNAAADTNGNTWLDAGDVYDFEVDSENNYIDTAADA